MKVKLVNSIFGTTEFEELSRFAKADFIMAHEDALENLTPGALEVVTIHLLRSMCKCRLIEIVPDESTGAVITIEKKDRDLKHDRHCPVALNLTNEDLSPKQLLRRQRLEVLCDHSYLTMIEEVSAGMHKSERRSIE